MAIEYEEVTLSDGRIVKCRRGDPFRDFILPALNEKQKMLLEKGSRREYRILATDEFFEKIDALIEENQDMCYGGWIPHSIAFTDWL